MQIGRLSSPRLDGKSRKAVFTKETFYPLGRLKRDIRHFYCKTEGRSEPGIQDCEDLSG